MSAERDLAAFADDAEEEDAADDGPNPYLAATEARVGEDPAEVTAVVNGQVYRDGRPAATVADRLVRLEGVGLDVPKRALRSWAEVDGALPVEAVASDAHFVDGLGRWVAGLGGGGRE